MKKICFLLIMVFVTMIFAGQVFAVCPGHGPSCSGYHTSSGSTPSTPAPTRTPRPTSTPVPTPTPCVHQSPYGYVYSSTASSHTGVMNCTRCGEEMDSFTQSHSFGTPTYSGGSGSTHTKSETCNTCNYTKNTPEAHSGGNAYWVTSSSTHTKKKDCSTCGSAYTISSSSHSWNNTGYDTVKNSLDQIIGVKSHFSCGTCGSSKTEDSSTGSVVVGAADDIDESGDLQATAEATLQPTEPLDDAVNATPTPAPTPVPTALPTPTIGPAEGNYDESTEDAGQGIADGEATATALVGAEEDYTEDHGESPEESIETAESLDGENGDIAGEDSPAIGEKIDEMSNDNHLTTDERVAQMREDGLLDANTDTLGDPVRIATGQYYTHVVDFAIKGAGETINISRYYDSDITEGYSFGKGWVFNYDSRMIIGAAYDYAHFEDQIRAQADANYELYEQALLNFNTAKSTAETTLAYAKEVRANAFGMLQIAQRAEQNAYNAVEEAARWKAETLSQKNIAQSNFDTHLQYCLDINATRAAVAGRISYIKGLEEPLQNVVPVAATAVVKAQAAATALANSVVTELAQDAKEQAISANGTLSAINGYLLALSGKRGPLEGILITLDEEIIPQAYSDLGTKHGILISFTHRDNNASAAVINAGLLHGNAVQLVSDANRTYQAKLSFENNASGTLEMVLQNYTYVESVYEDFLDSNASAHQARLDEIYSENSVFRNRYGIDRTANPHKDEIGIGMLMFVDERGINHMYRLTEKPDFNSTAFYPDGRQNYYPQGSMAEAATPGDPELELLADGRYSMKKKNGTEIIFNYHGLLESITERNGTELTFSYDANYELETITDHVGRSLEITTIDGVIIQISAPGERRYNYQYDRRYLVNVTDAEKAKIEYKYDSLGHLVEIVKPDQSSRSFQYINKGDRRVVRSTTDEEGAVEYFDYDFEAGYTIYTNPSGVIEKTYYNNAGLTTKTEYGSGSFSVSKSYDSENNLIAVENSEGETTAFIYDDRRNLVRMIFPDLTTEKWTYTDSDRVKSHTTQNGLTTTYQYDGKNRLVSTIYPDGTSSTYTYYPDSHNVETETGRLGVVKHFYYDMYEFVSKIEYSTGGFESFIHDPVGNLLQYTDREGAATYYHYNKDDNVVKIVDPAGNTETFEYNNRKDLVRKIDKMGGVTTFEYDKRHNLVTARNDINETVVYDYYPDGSVKSKNVADTTISRYEYDDRGFLEQVINELKNGNSFITQYAYTPKGQVDFIADPNNLVTGYGYDEMGRLTSTSYPSGIEMIRNYDSKGRVTDTQTTLDDGKSRYLSYEYDDLGRITRAFYDRSGTNYDEFEYYNSGLVKRYRNQSGVYTEFEYTKEGQVEKTIYADGTFESYTYDFRGAITASRDRNGNITTLQYDSNGQLIKQIYPDGSSQSFIYEFTPQDESLGYILRRTDPEGNINIYKYDKLGRLLTHENPKGGVSSYEYNHLGQITKVVDPLDQVYTITYDELGREVERTNPLGEINLSRYEGTLLDRTIDPMGRTTHYAYDRLGRVTKSWKNPDEMTSYTYNMMGLVTSEKIADSVPYQWEYDEYGRVISETNRLGTSKRYIYDVAGRLAGTSDFNGDETTFIYDDFSRVTEKQFPDGTAHLFEYDPVGNLLKTTGPEGYLEYAYNSRNRMVSSFDSVTEAALAYSYDKNGNKVKEIRIDEDAYTDYEYGPMSELTKAYDSVTRGTTTFEYDALNREIKRTMPDGIIEERTFDGAGRLETLKNYSSKRWNEYVPYASFAYVYNAAGQKTHQVNEYGQITSFEYDDSGRLAKVQYPFWSNKKRIDLENRLDLGLYDNIQNKWTRFKSSVRDNFNKYRSLVKDKGAESIGLASVLADIRGTFSVLPGEGATTFVEKLSLPFETENKLDDLFKTINYRPWKSLQTNQYVWTEEFDYDAYGNRISQANGWGETSYEYDADFRMTKAGNKDYSYDANGNLAAEVLGEVRTNYSYNYENRVIQAEIITPESRFRGIKPGTETISYTYDPFGRRTSRSRSIDSANGVGSYKNQYIYSQTGFDLIGEIYSQENPISNRWNNNGRRNNGRNSWFDSSFSWWCKPSWQKEPTEIKTRYVKAKGNVLSRTSITNYTWWSSKETRYYSHDNLRSVTMTRNTRGRIDDKFLYDAFGENYGSRFDTSNKYTNFGYNGKAYDTATEQYNYGYRDYSPTAARFTTIDPIKDGNNWYVYVNNDPVNYIDPFGLDVQDDSDGNGYSPLLPAPPVNTGYYMPGGADPDEPSIEEKIDSLGAYGNAYLLDGPTLQSSSTPTTYHKDEFVDHSRLATLGAMVTPLATEEVPYGGSAIKFPGLGSNVSTAGDTTLTTWSKNGEVVSYEVTMVVSTETPAGTAPGSVTSDVAAEFVPTTLSQEAAEKYLERNPELVDQALGSDKRSTLEKIIDWIF